MTQLTLGPADWLALAVYIAVVMAVGVGAGRFTKTTQDYFFAGQRFSWWLAAVSCIATLVGSYSFPQYSEIGYRYGFCSLLAYTNDWFVLPVFLFGWLPIVYYSRVHSIPEYFERRFDRRTRMAVLTSLMIYLIIYIGINLWTMGEMLRGLYPLGPLLGRLAGVDTDSPLGTWLARPMVSVALWAAVMATITGIYMHSGGQNTVMLTDLVQGFFLTTIGLAIFAVGLWRVGGLDAFWAGLPAGHRQPFAPFNHPPGLNTVGDFWSDGIAGTMAFYMINQGILMRFLSVRSVGEARLAMIVVALIFMPLAAVAVGGAGWLGRAMVTSGQLDPDASLPAALQMETTAALDPAAATAEQQALARERLIGKNIFLLVTRAISTQPGMYGLVIAAVVSAMLSTLDTYITAFSSVAVNDIWRQVRPGQPDRYYLAAARRTATAATVLGVALVPLFGNFDSIYQGLSFATSAINPPLVVVIVLGIFWRRFSAPAAFWTIVLGAVATIGSLVKPSLILPLSHGTSAEDGFPYLRALFGLVAGLALALVITAFDRSAWRATLSGRRAFWVSLLGSMAIVFWAAPELTEAGTPLPTWASGPIGLAVGLALAAVAGRLIARWDTAPLVDPPAGLVLATLEDARTFYKGSRPNDRGPGRKVVLPLIPAPAGADRGSLGPGAIVEQFESGGTGDEHPAPRALVQHPDNLVFLSPDGLAHLEAEPGDLVYVSDSRWWLGGFRSIHTRLGPPTANGAALVATPWVIEHGHLLADRPVTVRKVM